MLQRSFVHSEVESPFAWWRLTAAVVLGSIGTVGVWSTPVVLPVVQIDFGVARADASLPFTLAMLGFAFGGVLMGRLADRFGVSASVACGALALGLGYVGAGLAPSLIIFALMHVLIGIGTSATFGPIMADASRWFTRRRGIAVALAGSGNYIGGAIWPSVLQHFMASDGWRTTLLGVGVFCTLAMLPLLVLFARRAPVEEIGASTGIVAGGSKIGLPPAALQGLLCVAGLACCVAMAMPQVHIVAYCGDLGYGIARGA
jgi:MFS family permease